MVFLRLTSSGSQLQEVRVRYDPESLLEFYLVGDRSFQLPFGRLCWWQSETGQLVCVRCRFYELNADYVKYARFLGIKDRKIIGYVFRNAMLPQITGSGFGHRYHG
jgi:peptide/nickel transport system permease protein